MDNEFVKYLSKNSFFSDDMIKTIVENVKVKKYKKGEIILKEGCIVNECYLILTGCIRSYTIKNGEEKTIDFYLEEQAISPPGYGKSVPSKIYLECIEDTVAAIGTPEKEFEMSEKFPELKSAELAMTGEVMDNYQSSFIDYKITSAEERYLKIVKECPGLIQRVPQYQLASYLGIQPETLSRIRKRTSKK
jgi:CRP-like cAMP-binding protein